MCSSDLFFKDEHGATAIEYGLIAVALALCIIVLMPSRAHIYLIPHD